MAPPTLIPFCVWARSQALHRAPVAFYSIYSRQAQECREDLNSNRQPRTSDLPAMAMMRTAAGPSGKSFATSWLLLLAGDNATCRKQAKTALLTIPTALVPSAQGVCGARWRCGQRWHAAAQQCGLGHSSRPLTPQGGRGLVNRFDAFYVMPALSTEH